MQKPLGSRLICRTRFPVAHLDTILKVGGETVPHRQKAKVKLCRKKNEAKNVKSLPTLADVEREVLIESRAWGRQRLEQRLQELARQTGKVFPLGQHQRRSLTLDTELGQVRLSVDYGQ